MSWKKYITKEEDGSIGMFTLDTEIASACVPVLHKNKKPVNYLKLGATEWGEIVKSTKSNPPENGYRFDFINK